jgi:DNA helicase-2/ATP-dependent DNA helicase PcrA
MSFAPSAQQQAFFDWVQTGRGSMFIRARAGTGKTTTIVGAAQYMRGSVAFAAYNKKIAEEIGKKVQEAGVENEQFRSGTFHKFGYAALRQIYPRTRLAKGREKQDVLADAVKLPQDVAAFSHKLVSLAKNAAYGLLHDIDDDSAWFNMVEHHSLQHDLEDERRAQAGVEYARLMLRQSDVVAPDLVDFDDMIYVPAVKNVRLWQNDWVVVDEAQDTNAARRILAGKMLKPGGRSVWVGDDRQAIYGFTGADADAIGIIRKEFKCAELPLTVTYRCPKLVVAMAQEIVPDIQAHESAPEGLIGELDESMLHEQGLRADDAILCRKTAPLVSTAFALIKRGIACHVEGREIGQGLLKLARRWKVKNVEVLRSRLENFLEVETAKLLAKKREGQVAALQDKVETLYVLMEGCDTVDCVAQKINTLFGDDVPNLTLSTVHKAKGREWPRVYVLGMKTLMPSKWARQEWQMVQEMNLIYVAITRSKGELYNVTTAHK